MSIRFVGPGLLPPAQHPKANPKHWCGSQGILSLEAALVLEFGL